MSSSEHSIDVSIIMVDGGFRENFSFLPTWLNQSFPAGRYELIWVDYTDAVAEEVQALSSIRTFALDRHEEPQILAHAFNEGIRRARGDVVVLPDADVACEPDLITTVWKEISADPEMVLYVLRLDQPKKYYRPDQDFEYLKRTCTIKHTYNYGGCTAVHRKHLIAMNGYEELPFFAGYHYNGGDNYIRFKNMGLKIRWHPSQRVYHAWHPTPPTSKFQTVSRQERFIRRRAATWEWKAYRGIDASKNREYEPDAPFPSEWGFVTTERGTLRPVETGKTERALRSDNGKSVIRWASSQVRERGVLQGMVFLAGKVLMRIGQLFTDAVRSAS